LYGRGSVWMHPRTWRPVAVVVDVSPLALLVHANLSTVTQDRLAQRTGRSGCGQGLCPRRAPAAMDLHATPLPTPPAAFVSPQSPPPSPPPSPLRTHTTNTDIYNSQPPPKACGGIDLGGTLFAQQSGHSTIASSAVPYDRHQQDTWASGLTC